MKEWWNETKESAKVEEGMTDHADVSQTDQ